MRLSLSPRRRRRFKWAKTFKNCGFYASVSALGFNRLLGLQLLGLHGSKPLRLSLSPRRTRRFGEADNFTGGKNERLGGRNWRSGLAVEVENTWLERSRPWRSGRGAQGFGVQT